MATKPPPLVDQYGRPLRKEVLGKEIAAPSRASIRTIQSGHPAQGLTPQRLAQLLLAAEQGDATAYFELAEEMEEKDLHYLAVLRTRKLAVARLPIEVEPADDSAQAKEDAQLLKDWLDRDTLQLELFDILDAVGKGVSCTELIWDMKPDKWEPKRIEWRDPRFFEFDDVTGLQLLLRGGEDGVGQPTSLPPAKFITHFHPSKSGLPIRSGLARIAAWGYMFKNFAIKDWVTFLESYGHPIRIGKYGPNESEANKEVLHRALYELGSDAAAAFPETMSVEFVNRAAGTAPNDLWRSHAEYFDDQLSKAVLGQTNTTDAKAGGLGSGQAEVHDGVREDIEDFDAMLLAGTLNRDFVPWYIALNRGPRPKYPRIKIGRPDPVDVKTEIESAEKLASMGVSIDGEEMRERASLPAGKGDETDLQPRGMQQAPETPQEGQEGQNGAPVPKNGSKGRLGPFKSLPGGDRKDDAALQSQLPVAEPDSIDLTVDEALGDWEEQIDPLLAVVEGLMDESLDLSQLQSRLGEVIADMDVSAFQEMLARGGFAAHIAGLARPQPEAGE